METLSQSQKDALLNALEIQRNKSGHNNPAGEHLRQFGEFIESFPTSEPSENHGNQDASLTCNQDTSFTWIPVTEKLPVARELVLFTNSEDNWVLVGFVFYGKWYNYEDFPNPVKNGCECYPTHWQPLPPPPIN